MLIFLARTADNTTLLTKPYIFRSTSFLGLILSQVRIIVMTHTLHNAQQRQVHNNTTNFFYHKIKLQLLTKDHKLLGQIIDEFHL